MRDVLEHHLQPDSAALIHVRECQIANTRRRDGSRGTVEYELRLESAVSGRTWEQRVTGVTFAGGRTRRVWESLRHADPPDVTGGDNDGLPAFGYIPEFDMLLQVFPHDYRLPALAELMAGPPPELIPTLLAEFGGGDWRLVAWSAEPVQYRVDMRAILRISIRAHDGRGATAERQVFAKIYRDADDCQRAFAAQREVCARAAEAAGTLFAARTIAHLDGMRTLVTEALPGTPLSRIIRRGDFPGPAVQAAARAVAEFHRLDVAAPPRPVADDTARLREAEAFLIAQRPDLAPDVSTMVRTVIDGLIGAAVTPIHGDLKPDHIFIDGDRVALIDFDLFGTADPVADIAHLLAFLSKPQERARSRREQQIDAADVFVEAYFAQAPPSWRERLPIYHAMTSIHKAVGLAQRRGAEGHARLESVLREGQALLGEGEKTSVPTFKRRMTRSAARSR